MQETELVIVQLRRFLKEFSSSLICVGFHGRPYSSERNDAFEQTLTDIIDLL